MFKPGETVRFNRQFRETLPADERRRECRRRYRVIECKPGVYGGTDVTLRYGRDQTTSADSGWLERA